ncbi:hypothetical protein B0J13DRAFT_657873 [Dactylonectria estremocensis]|uniref:Uncharacterized protein n=1 Tax=Dactylonectria estremocensis TaxID=1079267 RepID=A0A9P9EZK8_9HYPO|nr:hypothetical protein B0J13DRAFT_657873 [Dactylonectria estremocensis]
MPGISPATTSTQKQPRPHPRPAASQRQSEPGTRAQFLQPSHQGPKHPSHPKASVCHFLLPPCGTPSFGSTPTIAMTTPPPAFVPRFLGLIPKPLPFAPKVPKRPSKHLNVTWTPPLRASNQPGPVPNVRLPGGPWPGRSSASGAVVGLCDESIIIPSTLSGTYGKLALMTSCPNPLLTPKSSRPAQSLNVTDPKRSDTLLTWLCSKTLVVPEIPFTPTQPHGIAQAPRLQRPPHGSSHYPFGPLGLSLPGALLAYVVTRSESTT